MIPFITDLMAPSPGIYLEVKAGLDYIMEFGLSKTSHVV